MRSPATVPLMVTRLAKTIRLPVMTPSTFTVSPTATSVSSIVSPLRMVMLSSSSLAIRVSSAEAGTARHSDQQISAANPAGWHHRENRPPTTRSRPGTKVVFPEISMATPSVMKIDGRGAL